MFGTHITRDNTSLPIITMETGHIVNTINCYTKEIKLQQELEVRQVSKFISSLCDINKGVKLSEEELNNLKLGVLAKCTPYLLELARRALLLDDDTAADAYGDFLMVLDSSLSNSFTELQDVLISKPKVTTLPKLVDTQENAYGSFDDFSPSDLDW